MGLTGISPSDPVPSTRRELIFAAGPSSGVASDRPVLLWGCRTATGSQTLDVFDPTDPVTDDQNAQARFGLRSELYLLYRKYTAIDPGATIYAIAVTASGGVAASVPITVTNVSTANTVAEITVCGQKVEATIESGFSVEQSATAIAAAINAADGGRLPVTATVGVGPGFLVAVAAANTGPPGDLIIGATATRGVRVRMVGTNVQTVAKTTGSFIAGSTQVDATAAISSAALQEAYYHVLPWHTVGDGIAANSGDNYAIAATDNGIGEWEAMIDAQALPINGKEQVGFLGMVNTQANRTVVATAINNPRAYFFSAENSDWTPGMIAAHCGALVRRAMIAHPGENMDWTEVQVPRPYVAADLPTATEIRADLNNGVSPLNWYASGQGYLVRFITSRSLNSGSSQDYRARDGHITSVVDFFWNLAKQRWESQRQPFLADDLAQGEKVTARTTRPADVKKMLQVLMEDLVSSQPLGSYDGPILAPDKLSQMQDSVSTSRIAGGIYAKCDVFAVALLHKGEFKILETSDAV